MARVAISEFQTANPVYAGAVVTFYTVDDSGAKTSTKATLYAGYTGSGTLGNPVTLDSEGRFAQTPYIDGPVVASIAALHVPDHDTGVIFAGGSWRGDWATATIYYPNDLVRDGAAGDDTKDLYVVVSIHTSGTWATDKADSTKMSILYDVSAFTQALPAPSDPGDDDKVLRASGGSSSWQKLTAAMTAFSTDVKALLGAANNAAALTSLGFSAFAKTLIDDADAATARSTLGIVPPVGRNALINGNFAVWQRGTSFTPGGGATTYTADRWAVLRGAANYTVSRQGTAEQYSLRSQRDSGTTDTDQIHAVQIIEGVNCAPLVGQTVQVSFDALAGANFSPGSSAITIDFATGTSADEGFSGFINGTWTGYALQQSVKNVTTSWVRYTAEFTVPSGAKEVGVNIKWLPTGTAGANDWLELRNIQVEAGSQATDFLYRPFTHELALCQRYFAKTFPLTTAPAEGAGATGTLKGKAGTTGNSEPFATWRYPVEMRAAPTITLYNPRAAGTDGQWDDATTTSGANARVNQNGSSGCILDNSGTLLAAASHFFIHAAADAEL